MTMTNRLHRFYKTDLAFIHDAGFADLAVKSASGIVGLLRRSGIRDGLVVELGCGSGLSARALTQAGYRVLGVDISQAMIAIAKKRAPNADFRVESLHAFEIPPCNAVLALGEGLNYAFDGRNDLRRLGKLFRRVYDALAPGGLFTFDVAEPGQGSLGKPLKTFTEGKDWAVLVEKSEDVRSGVLSRRIVTFRRVGDAYRRDEEVHKQRLFRSADIVKELRNVGFGVRAVRSYGKYRLLPARAGFVARKPR
jgi:SAM-dependent methyltransferase